MTQTERGGFRRIVAGAGAIAALTIALIATPVPVLADDAADAKALIDQAEVTLKNFLSDPDMKWFASHLQEAKGILILP
ncbi:MAG TPA: hypothetical protein VF019_03730, partial [Nitrospira sp.]